jgi:hypothetical protein
MITEIWERGAAAAGRGVIAIVGGGVAEAWRMVGPVRIGSPDDPQTQGA